MVTTHAGQESTFNLDAREIFAGVVFAHFPAVCVNNFKFAKSYAKMG